MTTGRLRRLALGLVLAALTALVVPGPSHAATPIIHRVAGGVGAGDATNVAQTPTSLAVGGNRLLVVDGPVNGNDLPPLDSDYPGIVWAVDLATGRETGGGRHRLRRHLTRRRPGG